MIPSPDITFGRRHSLPRKTFIGDDTLEIIPLGAGSEVGRSCILIQFKGNTVMLDCGIHPAKKGTASLPYFDVVPPSSVDVVLISHFHLDHCGALPYYIQHTNFRGDAYMTHPTKAIIQLLLHDYVRMSAQGSTSSGDARQGQGGSMMSGSVGGSGGSGEGGGGGRSEQIYSEGDVSLMGPRLHGLDYRQEKKVKGIRFWCYNAGHVLGAAMIMVEIAGIRVLYTGDYSSVPDRHLIGAEIPQISPHLLLVESTYGTQEHLPREERELRFKGYITEIVARGGKALVPVFALGRAQELLLILDEYWDASPALRRIPIYYASQMAEKCMSIYRTYANTMNDYIRTQLETYNRNPFEFKYIQKLRRATDVRTTGPCVVLASPGMLQSGLSRELYEMWCSDPKNGVVITAYCVDGTPARTIQSEPPTVTLSTNEEVPFRMSVRTISFSAHSDCRQTTNFVRKVRPQYIVLVHGSVNPMQKLRIDMEQTFRAKGIQVFTPRNTDHVTIEFRQDKSGKVLGRLAEDEPVDEQEVSGVLLSKDYQTHLVHPQDLSKYFGIDTTGVVQKVLVPVSREPWNDLASLGTHWSSQWRILGYPHSVMSSYGSNIMFKITDGIICRVEKTKPGVLQFSWNATGTADAVVDHLTLCLVTRSTNQYQKISSLTQDDHLQRALSVLKERFGDVSFEPERRMIIVRPQDGSTDSGLAPFWLAVKNDGTVLVEGLTDSDGDDIMVDDAERMIEEEEEGEDRSSSSSGTESEAIAVRERAEEIRTHVESVMRNMVLCWDLPLGVRNDIRAKWNRMFEKDRARMEPSTDDDSMDVDVEG